jgi:D-threo-aldose 1-dehydrogenase
MQNMNTRRDFLNLAAKGSAMIAAGALLPAASAQGSAASMNSNASPSNPQSSAVTTSTGPHFKPRFKFGIGGVPLGNEFAVITDEDAHATYAAAWEAGVRYYDVAPWYGLGLAERRLGAFIHTKDRDEYVLSTKVGKLLKASPTARQRKLFPFSPSPNDVVFDYTASGVRRSIEDSLQRLGVDRIDIAFVHDISSDNRILPMPWQDAMKIAIKGAFPELTRMRSRLAVLPHRPQERPQPDLPRHPPEERLAGHRLLA